MAQIETKMQTMRQMNESRTMANEGNVKIRGKSMEKKLLFMHEKNYDDIHIFVCAQQPFLPTTTNGKIAKNAGTNEIRVKTNANYTISYLIAQNKLTK